MSAARGAAAMLAATLRGAVLALMFALLATTLPCESFRHGGLPFGTRRALLSRAVGATPAGRAAPELSKVPFDSWLENVYPSKMFPVSPLYLEPGVYFDKYINTDKDTGCIMDNTADTAAHPIIDFDVEKAAEMILKNARSSVTGRGNAVYAIARGSGGGKSRIEEEIRRNLLRRENVLPVAITFNYNSGIELDDELWEEIGSKSKGYALSLTARVASATFGVEYETALDEMLQSVCHLKVDIETSEKMIRGMVLFFVRRVNEGRAALGGSSMLTVTPLVDTFVLLLDENRKVDTFAAKEDMVGYVRRALMNRRLPGVKVAVVISDLGFLPNLLRTKNINRRVDKKLVSDLMAHMLVEASDRYTPLFPPTYILKAAFFREEVPVDANLLRAFQDSVITNPLEERAEDAKMVPDVSLLLLKVTCAKLAERATSSNTDLARIIEQGVDSVQGAMLGTVDRFPRPGDALEEGLTQVLRIRLALAIENGSESLTLQRLCGLSVEVGYSDDTATALRSPLPLTRTSLASVCAREVVKLSASSYESSGFAFLAELDAIEVSVKHPIRILRSAHDDSWDFCVKAHNPDTGRPFHVFFDCKSCSEFVPGRNNSLVESLLQKRKQYRHTASVLNSDPDGLPRDHVYIYCLTHDGISEGTLSLREGETGGAAAGGLVVNGRDLLPHHCAVMGRKSTFELLGPFAELYRVVRSSLSDKLAANKLYETR